VCLLAIDEEIVSCSMALITQQLSRNKKKKDILIMETIVVVS
jgi:hypothetical protein